MPSKKKRNRTEQQGQIDKKNVDPLKIEVFSKHFSEVEVQSIKHVLKLKDLAGVPLLFGAAILNKIDVITNILQTGCNVDIQDQNHVTALFWAVKCKSLESIRILLLNNADPDNANSNGDHVILIAMDSRNWDEDSFIYLWNNLSAIKAININLLNKNGNSMLHMAVRRDWIAFIDIIITQGIQVNITNSSGVTPLMLASFRNSIDIVNKLIAFGAIVDKEDNNGFVALCYGFSAVVSKQLPVPNTVVQKLLTHMQSKKFSIYEYFQKRLEMIINPSNLSQNNGQPISGILLHIFTYAIRFLQNGMLILLDLGIFQKIQLAIQKNSSNTDRLRTVLSILLELVVYTDSCQNPVVDELRLSDTFDASGCSDICLEIMKKYENNKNIIWLTPISFKVIMQVCLVKGRCQEWLQNNYEDLQPFYEQARTVFFQNKTSDERNRGINMLFPFHQKIENSYTCGTCAN